MREPRANYKRFINLINWEYQKARYQIENIIWRSSHLYSILLEVRSTESVLLRLYDDEAIYLSL